MFKSKSRNNHKQLPLGGRGGRGVRLKPKTCKKHPKHEQSPGVCAVCLREKLTNLPPTSSKITRGNKHNGVISSSTSSSYLSSLSSQDYSSDVSSSSSPLHFRRSYSSMARFLKKGKNNNDVINRNSKRNVVFTKSRSLGFFMQKAGGEAVDRNHEKKKQGFLSKLLGSRTRNKESTSYHHGTMK